MQHNQLEMNKAKEEVEFKNDEKFSNPCDCDGCDHGDHGICEADNCECCC